MQTFPIHTMVTHFRLHEDEAAGIEALRLYGCAKYPGADTATIEFFDPAKHLDDRSEAEWLGDGYLFLGVRGGRFDDHPHEKFPHDCVFTMVVKDLGLGEDPAWQRLMKHVLAEDRQGAPHDLHLAALCKNLHQQKVPLETLLEFVRLGLFEGYLKSQQKFQAALKTVHEQARVHTIVNDRDGTLLTLAIVDGVDDESISKAARARDGLNAALVIHRNSAGNVYISSSRRLGVINVSWLAAELRIREQRERPDDFDDYFSADDSQLRDDGDVQGWYHQLAAGAIFCGSLTAPHVKPTVLPLETIAELAEEFLREVRLKPQQKGRS